MKRFIGQMQKKLIILLMKKIRKIIEQNYYNSKKL